MNWTLKLYTCFQSSVHNWVYMFVCHIGSLLLEFVLLHVVLLWFQYLLLGLKVEALKQLTQFIIIEDNFMILNI